MRHPPGALAAENSRHGGEKRRVPLDRQAGIGDAEIVDPGDLRIEPDHLPEGQDDADQHHHADQPIEAGIGEEGQDDLLVEHDHDQRAEHEKHQHPHQEDPGRGQLGQFDFHGGARRGGHSDIRGGTGLEPHYGTAVAGKKRGLGRSCDHLGRNQMPQLRVVNWPDCNYAPGPRIPYDHRVPLGAAGDRAVAVRPDGICLGGAAAHRQFRLGRHDLDLCGRAGRRGQRAVADRGRGAERTAMAGRSAGCDLVAAAGLHIADRTAHIMDDPRYAAFAKAWGLNAPWRMFIFLQNQALGSIPLAFAIFVAARFPDDALRWQDTLGVLILFTGIAARRSRTAQLKRFRHDPRTRVASATSVCGAGRAIPTISSNGSAGWPIP